MDSYAVDAQHLSKRYFLGDRPTVRELFREAWATLVVGLRGSQRANANAREMWALNDVSFKVKEGERLGIIGRNGAGKSTLLKILSRVVYPTSGTARIRGRVASLLEVGTGFNDNLSGRENVLLNAALHGLTPEEIGARFDDIVRFSEMARFIDTPVKHYSSGMKMRLAFAVAAHLDPDILILDEVLAVGDLSFQRKCLQRVGEMTGRGRTLIFVSHSMDAIMRYCDRCLWLDAGRIQLDGPARDVTEGYVEAVLGTNSVFVAQSSAASTADAAAVSPAYREEPSAYLVRVEARNAAGEPTTLFRLNEEIEIYFEFDVLLTGVYVPSIHLFSEDGNPIFASVPPDTHLEVHRKIPGRYWAAARIPPHLLNISIFNVGVGTSSPEVTPIKRHFYAQRVLTLHTVESGDADDSARGVMPRNFPGPLRPRLRWQVGMATRTTNSLNVKAQRPTR
jgi:lipopolysaccharide transport system ATP-binding protein